MLKNIFRKFKQQDHEAERIIFEKYYERVYYAAYSVIKDSNLAQDVVQETFMKAFKNRHKVEEQEKMGAWLATIATRSAIDLLRKMKKWNDFTTTDVIIDLETLTTMSDQASTVETVMEVDFLKEIIREEIDKLKPNYKEVLILYYFHDLTYEEIAKLLDINIGTVKTRIYRAKLKIKESIEKQPEIMEVLPNVRI